MKSLSKYIEEKRSHPELNKKISAYEQIKNYYNSKDRRNYFITFTQIRKVGINPKSGYKTPLGIYTYPVDPVFVKYMERVKSVRNVPFAGNQPNIFVVKPVLDGRFLMDMVKDYKVTDFNKDLKWLQKEFGHIVTDDDNKTLILNAFVRNAKKWAKSNTPIGEMWYITKNLSSQVHIVAETSWFTKNHSLNWNVLWRKLGYSGFCDRNGAGIIHQSEPYQAVFFSKKALRVVDHIDNRKTNVSAENFWDEINKRYREGKIKKITVNDNSKTMGSIDYEEMNHKWVIDSDFECDEIEISKYLITLKGGTFKNGVVGGGLVNMKVKDGRSVGYTKDGKMKGFVLLEEPVFYKCKVSGGGWGATNFRFCDVDNAKIHYGKIENSKISNSNIKKTKINECQVSNSKIKDALLYKNTITFSELFTCSITSTGAKGGELHNSKVYGGKISFMDVIKDCELNDLLTLDYCKNITDTNIKGKTLSHEIVFNGNGIYFGNKITDSIWKAKPYAWMSDISQWGDGNEIHMNGIKKKSPVPPPMFEKWYDNTHLSYKDFIKQFNDGEL